MSRCFPFPPPGYVRNSASGDALIESIKIERQMEKIKHERKEQKRREKEERKKEKKEKKREKKQLKSIQSIEGALKRKRDSDGFDKSLDKSWDSSKEVHLQKKIELEAEQIERSSLTEEYAQAILSESLSYSSDGTQSNTKKSRIEQSPSNGNCTTQGKVIRFRLKRRESENVQPIGDIPSTSGRTVTPITKIIDALPMEDQSLEVAPVPVTVTNDFSKVSKDFTPIPAQLLSLGATPAAKCSDALPMCSSSVDRTQKPKSPYDSLFSELLPPLIQCDALDGDDDQWLFTCKTDVGSLKACDGVSGQQSSTFWPRAHLLPEVDLYVLPFTVPF